MIRDFSPTIMDNKFEKILLYLFMVGFVSSALTTVSFDSFSRGVTFYFDGLLAIYAVRVMFKFRMSTFQCSVIACSLVYVIYYFVSFIYSPHDTGWYFVIQSLKIFFYLPIFVMFYRVKLFNKNEFQRFYNFLLFSFAVKYSVLIVLGYDRPMLLVENNYELLMLIMFYAFISVYYTKNVKLSLMLYFVVFVSGSRSALVTLMAVEFILNSKRIDFMFFIKSIIGLICLYIAQLVFISRMGELSIDEIDRVRFFLYFLNELKNYDFYNLLFGVHSYVPLDSDTCFDLKFYKSFFDKNTGDCYSSIFHAFNIRIIYDHGLLVMVVYFIVLIKVLFDNLESRSLILSLFTSIFLNGMSVSSLNNFYAVFPICVILLVNLSEGKYDSQ
ncbi:hypothetical protein BCU71_06530 [Vibrio lentus]|uniref:hypothetical protein n=1 Tax=Vibrio lentus TaxID=136468 RepID=UPI000C841DA3|nr:hypothetical protein [Vibrio lentus]PMH28222.1 hypothetical protein BCU71_06530 [Vibrio lentus]PMK70203.1 hypothetical protein BCT93_06165 [Vibrio lentus]